MENRPTIFGSPGERARFSGLLRAALPLTVEWFDPAGREVEAYRRHTALDPAPGRLEIRFPRAARMDPGGLWRVRVTERLTGRQAVADLQVAADRRQEE